MSHYRLSGGVLMLAMVKLLLFGLPTSLAHSSPAAVNNGVPSASLAATITSRGQNPSPPPATAAVHAEVMVLHASNTGGGIDPKIGVLPQLRKPPFSAYDTYKLINQSPVPLTLGPASSVALPDKRILQIALKEVVAPERYKVTASINQTDGSPFLRMLEVTTSLNEPFFVAGQSYKTGILVLGIKIVR